MINETNIEEARADYKEMTVLAFCQKWHVGSVKAIRLFGPKKKTKKYKYEEEREERECLGKRPNQERDRSKIKGYVAPIPKEIIAYKQQIAIMEAKNKEFRKNENYWKQDAGIIHTHYF